MLPAEMPSQKKSQDSQPSQADLLALFVMPHSPVDLPMWPRSSPNIDSQVNIFSNFGGAILALNEAECSESVLCASDAVVFVIDGNIGLSNDMQALWHLAQDNDSPRTVAILNPVTGRADFRECVASVNRVMSDDVLVRFEVIDNDDSSQAIGLYDLLTAEIVDYSSKTAVRRPADAEHLSLTQELSDELIDELAHAALSDSAFANFQADLPISLPGLVTAWNSDHIVSATPIDGVIGIDVLTQWLCARTARWTPVVEIAEGQTVSILDVPDAIGIGIGGGWIRLWHNNETQAATRFEVIDVHSGAITFNPGHLQYLAECNFGQTVRNQASSAIVQEPRF